ncbi:MAG TPA: PDZ domain-containing protein [Pirellulales bacterium]|jgi:hypothetical protein|nr:PDZ domain-containing protein [Pirellulales bacterium]
MNAPSSRRLTWASISVCALGLAASVVPQVVYTDPFWGIDTFADKQFFELSDESGVAVIKIESSSPASMAGLRAGDRIVKFGGRPVSVDSFRAQMADVQASDKLLIEGIRDGQPLHLELADLGPQYYEGVLFLDWQLINSPLFLLLLLILIATSSRGSLWPAILVTLSGLAVMVSTLIIETTQTFGWTLLWRARLVDHGPRPAAHYVLMGITLVLGLALSVLGAISIRNALDPLERTNRPLPVLPSPV